MGQDEIDLVAGQRFQVSKMVTRKLASVETESSHTYAQVGQFGGPKFLVTKNVDVIGPALVVVG